MSKKKSTLSFLKDNWIVKNLVLAVVFVLGVVLVAEILLCIFTRHGKEIAVPDFTGMTYVEAKQAADKAGVRVEVSDSVYVRQMRKGAVYNQNPKPGQNVKLGRRVMLTTNTRSPKKIAMPSLIGLSMREAKTVLASKGLVLGKLIYVQDIATNIVIKQRYQGRDIAPGTLICGGSTINLVVGLSASDRSTYVPNLKGVKYMRAIEYIQDNGLNVGRVTFDNTVKTYADTIGSFVWKQSPGSDRKAYTLGTEVSISLTVDPEKIKKK